ncbi:RNA polymerase factor sigma-54 [Planktomarina temperata]|nr:RNA polymerase factor sigma-54 [Planktomarina temperata]MDB4101021.1 RNA polymerase factor sigma-54 [Planktomarina temperata]MDC0930728.1 RNA polymerase factor sigma-54 [Planktomarina temperata]
MKLDFSINMGQRQGLTLTAQVQQAIKLLQMTNLEVNEYIEENFAVNPFVELNDKIAREKNSSASDARTETLSTAKTLEDTPFGTEKQKTKTEIENQFETGDSFKTKSTVSKEQSDFDPVQLLKSHDKSLYVHCGDYIESLGFTQQEQIVAYKFLEELEPTGWVDVTAKNVAIQTLVDLNVVEDVLDTLQMIEPAGLFARTLAECLKLQAKDKALLDETLENILNNLHLLGSGKFDLLKRRCGCSDAELAEKLRVIKSFDPKPGLQFSSEAINIREPDLKITKKDDGWLVTLNKSTLPSVVIDKTYAKTVRKSKMDAEQKEFIKEKIAEANWLKNALQKRNDTMLRVGAEIAKRQTAFLEKGQSYIQPMILRDVAEAVDMHESTISRVTTGSLMETPQGTLELKAFFSVSLQPNDDQSSQSSAAVKFKIRKLIDNEQPQSPISDDEIVETLKSSGINVARRTVAKYRKVQNIPASFMRKRQNTLSGML